MSKNSGRLDDYALRRVPEEARYYWGSIAMQRFGQLSCLPQFMLGSALGYGMTFWSAFWALTVGSLILECVSIGIGIIGQREGLSTGLLTRWAGFGRYGSAVVSLVVATSLLGWFGVQNEIFARGLHELIPALSPEIWAVICGLSVTLICVFGIASMALIAHLAVPTFLALAAWAIYSALQHVSLATLVASPPPGPPLSLAEGATMVAGGFIVASVTVPDMTRFNRSPWDVVKQTFIGMTIGEYLIGLTGVLLAHHAKTSDVVAIIVSSTGAAGIVILVTATIKINDWNLYSGALGIVNIWEGIFGRPIGRVRITLALGIVGTVLSVMGITSSFVDFLILLGVGVPPIVGIVLVDYLILGRHRRLLDESRAAKIIPTHSEAINPLAVVAWLLASILGYALTFGIPSLNSLIASMVLYWGLMSLFGNSVRKTGL